MLGITVFLLVFIGCINGKEIGSIGVSEKELTGREKLNEQSLQVFPDAAFTKSGMVSHVAFYASKKGDFFVGIWRPLRNATFKLIHKIHIVVAGKGYHDMWLLDKDRFPVKIGDTFGIHNSENLGEGEKSVVPILQARKGKINDITLSRVLRRWNYDKTAGVCVEMHFDNGYLWTQRLPLLEVFIERELVTLTKSHRYRNMEIGVVQMKVKGNAKKVCDARTVDEIAEAWGNQACQMINPNYIMVHAETLNDHSKGRVLEEPECPDDGDLTKCVEQQTDECERQHQSELIGCAESKETALVPIVVNTVQYTVTSC